MSLHFDGINDIAQTLTAPVTAVPFTLACWIKPDDASIVANQFFLTLSDASDSQRFYLYIAGSSETPQGALACYAEGSAGDGNNIAGPLTDDVWQHVCLVCASATDRRLYLNGGSRLDMTGNVGAPSVDRFQIGSRADLSDPFGGFMADVAVWNAALSDAQAAALASFYPSEVAAANLAAYWPLRTNADPTPDVVGANDLDVTGATFDGGDNPMLLLAAQSIRGKLQYRKVGQTTWRDVLPE